MAVTVDAPERLASFAKIERTRREEAPFPLTLDAGGMIAAPDVTINSLRSMPRCAG